MGDGLSCDRCGNEASYIQRYSGKRFCPRCFNRDLRRRVRRRISRERMIHDGDFIVFAVSGGKDSIACLDIVSPPERRRGVEMAVLTIDEGIEGYRSRGVEISRRAARERGIEFYLTSFREQFGADLDSILRRAGSPERACTFCGVLRRWALNREARELGADRLITGHNLDDEAQSALLNLIRGDPARLARAGPGYILEHPKFVPRSKPLRRIPGRETLLYDLFQGLEVHLEGCPYSSYDMRNEIRSFLNMVEEERPTSKSSFLSTAERLGHGMAREFAGAELAECRSCGEPTVGGTCKACQLLGSVGLL